MPIATILAIAILLAAACGGGSGGPSANGSAAARERIAFDACESLRVCGLCVAEADGSDARKIAAHAGISDHVWSPDGALIAFVASDAQLYVVRPDGSQLRLMPTTAGTATQPAWSPSGDQIALAVGGQKTTDIFVVNVNDSKFTKITNSDSSEYYGYRTPAWSPNGNRIAFGSTDGIYAVDPDGGSVSQIANETASAEGLAWSPDGNQIAFLSIDSGAPGRSGKLQIINSDGTGRRTLAPDLSLPLQKPAWSPDGSRLAFFADVGGDFEVFVVNADGTGLTNLTNNNVNDYDLSWSANGEQIAFVSIDEDDANIHVMNSDGSGVRRLTDSTLRNERAAAWAPVSQSR